VDVVEDGPEFGGGLEGAEFFKVVVPGGAWRCGAWIVVPEGPFVVEGSIWIDGLEFGHD